MPEDERFIVQRYPQPRPAGKLSPTARELIVYLTAGGSFGRVSPADLFPVEDDDTGETISPKGSEQ